MLKILKPGLLSTVQDLGRIGYQKQGVIASGVMDPVAHRIANLLVGNDQNEASLEMTLAGPKIEFQESALISICGGDLAPHINGEPVKQWRPVYVQKGSVLTFGQAKEGCRAYLAVAGGIDVPVVMESRSTYMRAEIGGFHGRSLESNDELMIGTPSPSAEETLEELEREANDQPFVEMDWYVATDFAPQFQEDQPIRVIKGREFELFTTESQQALFSETFKVSSKSDRMGYRLEGAELSLENKQSMISEAVAFGTIQVPSNGQPIVLLADRQTTGGYPKIAQIASVDLPVIGQMKPGATISFEEITLEEAQKLYLNREKQIQELTQGILLKSK